MIELQYECQRCGAKPGAFCVNYKGQRKAMCPDRGKATAAKPQRRKGGNAWYQTEIADFLREEVKVPADAKESTQ